jgi:methylaspartate mutase epsilon subunit
MTTAGSLGAFVARARAEGRLVVQPRMGFSSPERMRAGLIAVKNANATTVGTITLDSYTRVGEHTVAARALADGVDLNGYPLVTHSPYTTREILHGVHGIDFPVQVRHGSSDPRHIVAALVDAGLDATEGGPVSYCLPYSRTPLRESVANWARACEPLVNLRDRGAEPHMETFGGCMMGQLCPPSLLIALSLLEGMFFRQQGLTSISLSYAQQTSAEQDEEAIGALHELAGRLLPDVDWHIVLYAYMGAFPKTVPGARALLAQAAELATRTGCARLIVKTIAEAHRIPTIEENVAALEHAAIVAATGIHSPARHADTGIYAEARTLIDAALDLGDDVGTALCRAFERGYLDVPYCLHPDNAGRTRGFVDATGRLAWSSIGAMPIADIVRPGPATPVTSSSLLTALSYMERRFDGQEHAPFAGTPALAGMARRKGVVSA